MNLKNHISSVTESPPEPDECPIECPYYTPERGGDDYCQRPLECEYLMQGELFQESMRAAREECDEKNFA